MTAPARNEATSERPLYRRNDGADHHHHGRHRYSLVLGSPDATAVLRLWPADALVRAGAGDLLHGHEWLRLRRWTGTGLQHRHDEPVDDLRRCPWPPLVVFARRSQAA